MDGSDVSLAIRRARRSGATSIDLSNRGLRCWPEGLSSLRSIKKVDLSCNELSSLDPAISSLEELEELNLSENRLEAVPELNQEILPNLRSLALDGNPIAMRLSPATLRGLVAPSRAAGQMPSQVIRSLLFAASHAESPGSRSLKPSPLLGPGSNQIEEFSTGDNLSPSWLNREVSTDVDRKLNLESENPAWRQQQKVLLKEMERLQARVSELESSGNDRPAGGDALGLGGGGSVPSWLQKDRKKENDMSATLPSRRHGQQEDNEAADLRNQLREEQRKSKRFEKDVQRLTDRLNERELSKGASGSAAHYEMHEVELGKLINQGGFSVVHEGLWHKTKVAIKKIFDPNITEDLLAEFDNEIHKLEQIRHPHIIQLLGVHRKPPGLSLITELVEGGSFFQLLHAALQFHSARGPVTSVEQSDCMQILETSAVALTFLHARGIIHRDVKSHNVLLSPHLEVKVCDFGLARMRSELMTGAMQFAGTPCYMAPEMFRQQRYCEKVDVFAYGVMLWEAIAQDLPFANLDPPEIRERVLMGQMLPIPGGTAKPVQALMHACWTLDQERRPAMGEVLEKIRDCMKEGSSSDARSRRPRTAGPGGRRDRGMLSGVDSDGYGGLGR